jgi:putative tryptophan/tyrosine transport system ATP-binding protein
MIALKNIHVYFNRRTPLENHALKDCSLSIATGEFVTVIGGNGAGKSTLLNLLAGDVLASQGRVELDGINVSRWGTLRRSCFVSRVFQDPLLGSCASLSIEENLALASQRGQKRGLGLALSTQQRDVFRELLADLKIGLEHRLQDPMGALSGGQRQAVSLVMATLRPSKILLLDEHTAALDPKMAKLILGLTQRLISERQLTALMITHSMIHALEYGDRTLLMREGRIERDLKGCDRQNLKAQDLLEFLG